MNFTAKLYDSEGNEIEVKPGHAVVMGKESMRQVPIDEYEAQFVYKPPTEYGSHAKFGLLKSEWGGTACCMTSDGRIVNMADELNRMEKEKHEELHDD